MDNSHIILYNHSKVLSFSSAPPLFTFSLQSTLITSNRISVLDQISLRKSNIFLGRYQVFLGRLPAFYQHLQSHRSLASLPTLTLLPHNLYPSCDIAVLFRMLPLSWLPRCEPSTIHGAFLLHS